jgi:hypothetical protein
MLLSDNCHWRNSMPSGNSAFHVGNLTFHFVDIVFRVENLNIQKVETQLSTLVT